MDLERLKEWLEIANQYQQSQFLNLYQQKGSPEHGGPNPFLQEIFPRCDIYELENDLIFEAEVPGVTRSDIEIRIENGQLFIEGECRTLKPNLQYYLKERQNRKFAKSITLPYPVDSQKMKSSYKDGILTVLLPKKKEEKSVHIPIVE